MGKRHVNRQRNAYDDTILMSSVDGDVDFEAAMQAMDRRFAQRKRRSAKLKRNRFDDYEQDEWLNSRAVNWDDLDQFEDDLDFAD